MPSPSRWFTALALETIGGRHVFRLSFHFGLFQAAMLAAGWLFGSAASEGLRSVDHWIAFGLLALAGARMILNAFRGGPEAVQSTTRRPSISRGCSGPAPRTPRCPRTAISWTSRTVGGGSCT